MQLWNVPNASPLLVELARKPDGVVMYTDSMIVLGYLHNDDRRFAMYIDRRKQAILSVTAKEDWVYVATDRNPADYASRPIKPADLLKTCWLTGPEFLWDPSYSPDATPEPPMPSDLPEEKLDAVVLHVREIPSKASIFSGIFTRISRLTRLVGVVQCVNRFIRWFDRIRLRLGHAVDVRDPDISWDEAVLQLVMISQWERYPETIHYLQTG